MTDPKASRPYMPGYGILPAGKGTGLLPWDWALRRLRDSHDYWVVTVWPDGRPHTMPVWGVWDDGVLWFSSSLRSRKIRNIQAGSRVSVSTDDARNPVVLEGIAEIVTETPALKRFLAGMNEKYDVSYSMDFMDPAMNASVRVRPVWAFGVAEDDFSGSPTRWDFDG
jgi:PPOX class probable F420-dependent enzyme